ncbi:hypothetical protein CARUB_v10006926mg [Capsella rubella]|uniref:SWIM-type domain-containing protein n=1 Tax=Capsella rubella TaxID=81985 RepID=R0GG80_9BRAS|nr:hypothetical protein CARUB_v10006926mg [Capsella rubella]
MGRCMSISKETTFDVFETKVANVLGVDLCKNKIWLSFWYPGESAAFTQGKMPPITITNDVQLTQYKIKHTEYGGLYLYATVFVRGGYEGMLSTIHSGGQLEKAVDNNTLGHYVEHVRDDGHMQDETSPKAMDKKYGVDVTSPHLSEEPYCVAEHMVTLEDEVLLDHLENVEAMHKAHSREEKGMREKRRRDLIDEDDQMAVDMLAELFDEANGVSKQTCLGSGDDTDYDFDEWTDRINKEYPPDWDPFVNVGGMQRDVGSNEMEMSAPVVHRALKVGQGSGVVKGMGHMRRDRWRRPTQPCRRMFANKDDMRNTLSLYAMKRLFSYRINKSDKERVIVNCVDKKCGWRVYATTHKGSENLEIKTVQLTHSCDVASRSRYGEKATAKVLADLLKSKFETGKKGPRACDLPGMVLSELNVTISYTKAWNAKELAIAAARGDEEESYRFLATYLHLLKTTNPGTITDMHTTKDNTNKVLFKYLFFAFGASISGYKYLRKVIVIDGTAMKGKYKGCLVAASGQDGNMQVYPLAFGVVDGENTPGWVWFFKNLKKFVPDEEDLVFVSDRHASIYAGLREVYPLAHHGSCTVHLVRNVRHNFDCDGLASIVNKEARAYTVGDFRVWWAEIKGRSQKCAAYLTAIGLPHWTLSHFPGIRYNIMSSNISESLNAAMQKAIDYPVVPMVEFIRAMLMRWFYLRRIKANKARTRCTPEIEAILIEHLREALNCAVLSASEWVYQVNDGSGCSFIVDLENKTCTCRVFDVLKVPCCHALAARGVRQLDVYSFVDQSYFVEPWQKKYEKVIMPVPKERDTDIPPVVNEVPINPPKERRGGGRPRKRRIPSQGEKRRVRKRKNRARCGRCYGVGHNRKTCSNLI